MVVFDRHMPEIEDSALVDYEKMDEAATTLLAEAESLKQQLKDLEADWKKHIRSLRRAMETETNRLYGMLRH